MSLPPESRTALRRTMAVINGKGGVGKTSTVSNVGGLLASAGYKVLLVDLDVQGNLAEDLGYVGTDLNDEGLGLFQAVSAGQPIVPVRGIRPGLDVVPGGERLEDLDDVLSGRRRREGSAAAEAFAASLAPTAAAYDLVLIDCPPGQEVLQEVALVAARWVIIPTRTDVSSRKGLRKVARRFDTAGHINPELQLLGVILHGATKAATRITAEAIAGVQEDFSGSAPLFTAHIRYAEAAAVDARKRGQLVHELERDVASGPKWWERRRNGQKGSGLAASAGTLAQDYQALAEEIVDRLADEERRIDAEAGVAV